MALNLQAKISLDGSGFTSGLKGIESAASSFASRVAGLFTIGAIAAFTKQIIDFGSAINDATIRLGVSSSRVQELGYAARQSGGDLGDIESGLTKLQKSLEEIHSGSASGGALIKSFSTLGVTIQDLATMKPDEILGRISDNIAATGINSEKTAAMLDIFGKNGGKLIPILAELNSKSQEAKDKGLIISDEEIKRLDEAGDLLDQIYTKAKALGATALVGMIRESGIVPDDNMPKFLDSLFFGTMEGQGKTDTKELIYKLAAAQKGKGYKQPAAPDYRGLGSSAPPYKYDPEEENNINNYNKARTKVLSRMAAENRSANGDSLVSVGNFLGAKGGLQDAANREIRRQTQLQERMLGELQKINSGASDITFPL